MRKVVPNPFERQRGLGLPTALFVITVMAFLAAVINQLVQSNAETAGEEVLLVRAFYAAESGVQFGLNGVFPPDGSGAVCPALPVAYPGFEEDGLNGCTATMECEVLEVDEISYYTITSTGSCGEVSRKIQVRAK